ncbi:MAG: hypothetical protein WBG90_01730 [Saonia sp.]
MYRTAIVFAILLALGTSMSRTYGQGKSLDSLYYWFDTVIGEENSGLFAAVAYVEEYKVINENHRFFNSPNFNIGSIWYDGQPYIGIQMKYDLYGDEVLVNHKNNPGIPALKMIKSKIDSFRIDNRKFVKVKSIKTNSYATSGFHEILMDNSNFTLFKKHKKKEIKRLDRKSVYYEFKDDSEYAIVHKGTYSVIRKKKDVLTVFPQLKRAIRRLYKNNVQNTLSDDFMRSILHNIRLIQNKSDNPESE